MARPAIVAREPIALPEHELLARVFRTLGDSSRLQMLELLIEHGSMTQSELIQRVGIVQSRASEHLSCLVWCGFLEATRTGRIVHYRIIDPRAADMVELARAFLKDNGAALGSCGVLAKEPSSRPRGRRPDDTVRSLDAAARTR